MLLFLVPATGMGYLKLVLSQRWFYPGCAEWYPSSANTQPPGHFEGVVGSNESTERRSWVAIEQVISIAAILIPQRGLMAGGLRCVGYEC